MEKIKRPVCKLIGTDGNIFALAGKASMALKKAGEDPNKMQNEIFKCKTYAEALAIIGRYVIIT